MTAPITAVDDQLQITTYPPSRATTAGVSRFVVVLAVTGTILLALGAFWLSFTTLRDLAVLSGVPEEQAWIWPLIVDGVILEATISVVALRNSARTARRFAWLLLAAGAGVSVAANITHAIVAADTRVPALIAALVASVPPLVLLAMTHLTVELTRNSTPATTPELFHQTLLQDDTLAEEAQPAQDLHALAQYPSDRLAQPEPSKFPQETAESADSAMVPDTGVQSASPRPRADARTQARQMSADGIPRRQIAASLGVHPTTIGRWVNVPDRQQDGD